jgi:hypothetical protein
VALSLCRIRAAIDPYADHTVSRRPSSCYAKVCHARSATSGVTIAQQDFASDRAKAITSCTHTPLCRNTMPWMGQTAPTRCPVRRNGGSSSHVPTAKACGLVPGATPPGRIPTRPGCGGCLRDPGSCVGALVWAHPPSLFALHDDGGGVATRSPNPVYSTLPDVRPTPRWPLCLTAFTPATPDILHPR